MTCCSGRATTRMHLSSATTATLAEKAAIAPSGGFAILIPGSAAVIKASLGNLVSSMVPARRW